RDGLRLGYLAAEQLWGTYSLITYDVQAGALLPSGTSDAADRTVWKFDWVATSHELITQSFSRDWELRHRKSGGAERPIVTRDFVGQWSLGPDGALAWMDGDLVRYLPSRGRRASIVFDFRAGTSRPRLAEVEEFVWRSEHASEYAGELLRPPPDKCASRWPLIVAAYPGATGWMEPINANQAWAAMGYVVFKPRPPAPHVWMNASAGTSATKQGPDVWKTTVDVV